MAVPVYSQRVFSPRCGFFFHAALLLTAFLGWNARASTVCPPEGDDSYVFSCPEADTGAFLVPLKDGGFAWPALQGDTDSALLWLSLQAGADPIDVTLASRNRISKQTFASGTRGWRALNASAFVGLPAGEPITLNVAGGSLMQTEARLQAFANQLPLDQRILVLAPHPDDAEMAAFGVYAGRRSTIITITAGNAGDFNYCESVSDPAAHYRLKGQLRVIDSVTVPWHGQVPVDRAFNLGYFDARLQAMLDQPFVPVKEAYVDNDNVLPYRSHNQGHLLPIVSRKATWNNLVEDLRTLITKLRPQVVITPDPRLDMHRDHQLTTAAFAQALEQTSQNPKVLLYTNHADRNLYPRGPAGQDLPLPPWCGPQPLEAHSFFAHPLSPELQTRKLMALESMHDLRLSPTAQFRFGWQPQEACRHVDPLPPPEATPLRGAVRPFELFFVVGRPQLLQLGKAAAKVR